MNDERKSQLIRANARWVDEDGYAKLTYKELQTLLHIQSYFFQQLVYNNKEQFKRRAIKSCVVKPTEEKGFENR